ncbi:MAG: hypothetical protein WAT93_12310, partial [Pontixanthobacter sp.]
MPTDVRFRFLALGLTALVAACARGGNDLSTLASAADSASYTAAGPEADYPVVVGDPYSIDGTVYT